jgi:glycosyltransferase involved in cell wall biosynthesis
MKVLEMVSSHHWTGPAAQVLSLSEGLAREGVDVEVAVATVPAGDLPGRVTAADLPLVAALHLYKRRFSPRMTLADLRWLGQAFAERRYDLIHCHLSHDHSLALLARRNRRATIPIVRTVHHSTSVRRRPLQGLLYRPTDGLIAISEKFGRELVANFRLPPERVRVVMGAIDHVGFRPLADRGLDRAAVRARYGLAPSEFLVGIVSRIKAGRGHPELIEAFARVAPDLPDARLVIIGRGELRAEMEYTARRFGLADRARFLGYLGDDLPDAVGMLDVKVLLGEGSDGSCRAATEALACGVPVLAAPVGTMPETVRDERTGWLLPALSVRALTIALTRIARDRGRLPAMGAAARADVEARFTEATRTRATLAFFREFVR